MRTLNCKRTARMISLYVAGDLVGSRGREVAAHLAACEACHRLAEEFSESSTLLTQALTPPEFGAEFYSGIRSAVLGEITRDRMLAKPSLFRPWLYATAFGIVIIASAVMLHHAGVTWRQTPRGSALVAQAPDQPPSGQAKGTKSPSSPQLSAPPKSPRKSGGSPGARREQSDKALAVVNAGRTFRQLDIATKSNAPIPDENMKSSQTMRSSTSASTGLSTSSNPDALKSALSGSSTPSPAGRTLQIARVEIQTADPNIRIIWLTPRETPKSEDSNKDKDQFEKTNRK